MLCGNLEEGFSRVYDLFPGQAFSAKLPEAMQIHVL